MKGRAPGAKGYTLIELLLVVAGLAILAGISVPLISAAFARARTDGGAAALAGAIRDARMRAIATGWQYAVVAYDGTGAVPNAFRIQGINPAAPGPPPFPAPGAVTDPPVYGAAQMAEAYTSLAREFGGNSQITVPGGGGVFTVIFDSRGQWPGGTPCVPAACSVRVSSGGRTATITVSAAGAVVIQ